LLKASCKTSLPVLPDAPKSKIFFIVHERIKLKMYSDK
jgi:hypothetical protein